MPLEDTFGNDGLEQLIRYQRFLIFRMNLMKWDEIDDDEILRRGKDFDEFTEWVWNESKFKGKLNEN